MNFFERIHRDCTEPADAAAGTSRRQLLLATAGVLTIATCVVLAAGFGTQGRHSMAATAPAPPAAAPLPPLLDIGAILSNNGLAALSTSPVSIRLLAGQTMMTHGYRNAQGKHEFALVTPEVVDAEDGTAVRMNLRVFSLDDAQLVLAGLEATDQGSALRPGGSRIWSAEDIDQKLAAFPADIHRAIPSVTVAPGSSFSTTLGESADALFFLEGKAVPGADGGFELETDLKCVVKN